MGGSAPTAREAMLRRLREAVAADERVVGLVDYGSGSYGRADEWSDLDVTLFIRDEDFDEFHRNWKLWAGRLGRLLLTYVGGFGHPWTVYDAEPVPLRVDFDLMRASQIEAVAGWENSPVSVAAMVLYDGSGGRLTAAVEQLVGKSLAPADPAAEFERLCGDFWYFLLYSYSKLQRGEQWLARQVFHSESLPYLAYLLRFEAGAMERWRWSQAAFDLERSLAAGRLAQLETCIASAGAKGLRRALGAAAHLGRDVCASIAAAHGWPWPAELADRVVALFGGSGQ